MVYGSEDKVAFLREIMGFSQFFVKNGKNDAISAPSFPKYFKGFSMNVFKLF